MKKLCILTLIVVSTLLANKSFAQSIVLINGQPTEVILDGEHIESIVNTQIIDYLEVYDQAPQSEFKFAKLRTLKQKVSSENSDTNRTEEEELPRLLANSSLVVNSKIK